MFDKPDPLEGPYFEETLYVTPSRLAPDVLARVERVTADAAHALGLTEGPIHAEVRVDGDRVWVVEVEARSIGGSARAPCASAPGISLEEVIVRHALGLPIDDLRRAPEASGVMMLPIPRAGTLVAVRGQDDARSVPGIVGLEITIVAGRAVAPVPEGDRYLQVPGFASAETPLAVEQALRAAHARLDIEIR